MGLSMTTDDCFDGLADDRIYVRRISGGGTDRKYCCDRSAVKPELVSAQPSAIPSSIPSDLPSNVPSVVPSLHPSSLPSFVPSTYPSLKPSSMPSWEPSNHPSSLPSSFPSNSPSTAKTAIRDMFDAIEGTTDCVVYSEADPTLWTACTAPGPLVPDNNGFVATNMKDLYTQKCCPVNVISYKQLVSGCSTIPADQQASCEDSNVNPSVTLVYYVDYSDTGNGQYFCCDYEVPGQTFP
jgi:hypothetical protein